MDDTTDKPEKISVLRGSLRDISLLDLIQVLSMGRQYMSVELEASGGDVVGALLIKSGMLLDARTREARGKDAFFFLIGNERAQTFTAFRLQQRTADGVQPLGPIDRLLMESTESAPAIDVAAPEPAIAAGEAPVETRRGRLLAVSSPKGGVGKTTLALNLAVALAERGLSVLLVDADPLGGLGDSLTHRVREADGLYEMLRGELTIGAAIIQTRIRSLRIVPAGHWPADSAEESWRFPNARWARVFRELAAEADIVLVDTAAGLHGVTASVLRQCDDVLGILQAEALGARSFKGLLKFLDQFAVQGRPRLGGVVINMFHHQQGAGHPVVHDALKELPANIVMQPAIPRDPVLVEASSYGVPVALLGDEGSTNLPAIFDSLAADLSARLGVGRAPLRHVISLVD